MKNKAEYNPSDIEKKWQGVWEENKTFSPDLWNAKNPYYTLMMFPYPSAEGLHIGNMYAFTGADIHGRYMRMRGKDVFEPIGLDGFGIHSENYALKVGRHPREQAKISEKNFYRQLRAIGNAYDWQRTLETYDPLYYRWTQWIFVQMFKKGLAYRKKAQVNWCPSDKTVLADEQVIDGKCERDGSLVEKRDLEQWFFKITEYTDALLNGLTEIDWPEKIKIAQRQWIGKSQGTKIKFKISNLKFKIDSIEVFTTRADTLFGATFLVIAPEHPFSSSMKDKEIQDYIKKAKAKTDSERMENKEKTGVFSGFLAINPLNNEKIPIWIADYAVMGYGTGALFGDAHDERDAEFAHKYGIPLKPTLATGDPKKDMRIKNLEEVFTGYGTLFDSGEFSGLSSEDAKKKITAWLKNHNAGGPEITYHLRDWLISRQRYWGPPIPMIYCSNCEKNRHGEREDMPGWWTVPEEELPVELPDVEDWRPLGTGVSPLANHPEFYEVKCPNCKSPAKRETDVSDTFLDSAWYYLRYLSVPTQNSKLSPRGEAGKTQKYNSKLKTDADNVAYDIDLVKKWCPVAIYIGGAEHSVLHLLYVRFLAMVLHDLKIRNPKPEIRNSKDLSLPFTEPFPRFFAHGLIISEGAKMSKSRGNVVIPDGYIRKFGADTLRMYLMFLGPYSQGGDFRDSGIEGMHRFSKRLWRLFTQTQNSNLKTQNLNSDRLRVMHKTIKQVTQDIELFSYNTAIARMMEWYNFLAEQLKAKSQQLAVEESEVFLKLLAPFAPHFTEELFENLKLGEGTIHLSEWPKYDEKYLVEDRITVVVQVNAKVRDSIKVKNEKLKVQSYVEEEAKQSEKINKYLEGKEIKKVIYVPGKIINFVIE